jgi:outer membrane protein OmpA-like peptidoglycan-associated protein
MKHLLLLTLIVVPGVALAQFGVTQNPTSHQYIFCKDCPAPTPKVLDLPEEVQTPAQTAPVVQVIPRVLPVQVLFKLNSTQAMNGAHLILQKFANDVKSGTQQINVVGHTDKVGSIANNVKLAERRAQVVKEALIGMGVDQARLAATSICCIGSPPSTNPDSRRVDISVQK